MNVVIIMHFALKVENAMTMLVYRGIKQTINRKLQRRRDMVKLEKLDEDEQDYFRCLVIE